MVYIPNLERNEIMTQRYFLSSKYPLPTGTFGRKEKQVTKNINFSRSELDFTAIIVKKIKKAEIPVHLKNPYCVTITPEGGQFKNGSDTDIKCLKLLFDYITEANKHSFSIELYSAWYGEENDPVLKYTELKFKDLISPLQLNIEDREYLIITKKDWN